MQTLSRQFHALSSDLLRLKPLVPPLQRLSRTKPVHGHSAWDCVLDRGMGRQY